MPEISVIVPVYKVEPYLRRCVDSILNQTFQDFELILVDDGSPDNCPAICDEYAQKDSRILTIHVKNGGVSHARNIALERATGNYLAFCDGDDAWEKDLLKDNYETACAHDADMVVFNYEKIWDDQSYELSHYSTFSPGLYEMQSGSECLRYMAEIYFKYRHGYEVWCRLIRADLVKRNNIRFCTSCDSFAEDMGFVAKCLLHTSRIFCSEQNYYKYYVRNDSLMMSKKNQIRLNEMNNISVDFKAEYMKAARMTSMQSQYPIFHYLIMFTQYQKIMFSDGLKSLPVEIDKIKQKNWYENETRGIDDCKEDLVAYFGRNAANKMLSISHYCLHKSWFRFRAENLMNKVFEILHR